MRQIPGFWNYMATDEGEIYSLLTHKIMRPSTSKNGYLRLMLRVNGDSVSQLVHRLVASAYLDNPENLTNVNHKDGIKTNNHPYNLEYCTPSENNYHCSQVLRKKIKPVQLTKGGVSYWWPSQYECAKDTGLPFNSVSALHKGVRRMAKGWNSTHFEERE